MPTQSGSLNNHFDSFPTSEIEAERYTDASEVVREGVALLGQRDAEECAKIAWLRGAAWEGIEAIEQGAYTDLASPDAIGAHLRGLRSTR